MSVRHLYFGTNQVITIGVRESEVARLISSNAYIKPEDGKWSVVTDQTFASLVALLLRTASSTLPHRRRGRAGD